MVPYPKGASTDCIAREDTIVQRIQDEFADIECTGIPNRKPKHGFIHEIKTMGGQVLSPCRRLDSTKLAEAKQYFKEMVAARICI